MNPSTLSSLLPMLMEAFGYVLRSSLLGAVAVLLVVFARWVLGARLAPAARGWLWFPVVVLFLSPQLPALFNWDAPTEAFAKPVREVLEPALSPIVVRGEPTLLVEPQLPTAEVEVVTMSTREKIAIAWAAGGVSIFGLWLIAYAGLWRRVRREQGAVSELLRGEFRDCVRKSGLRRAPRLLVTRAVDNPAVAGLWRPTVLMPPGLEDSLDRSALRHVLLHELRHIRRLDLWLHWASALLVALHWFNPFVWFASRKFRADREAACDASVIHASDDQAHAYGQTLLALGSRMTPAFAPRLMAGMLGGADLVKQRIVDITRRSRNSRVAAWCTFIVVMLGTGMLAVMAAEPAAPKAPATETKAENKKTESTPVAKSDSGQLFTRTFKVPPDFMAWMQEQIQQSGGAPTGSGQHPRLTAVELLKQMGVLFPEGASATFIASTSQLIVRNNMEALDVIKAIVDVRLNDPVRQIYVTSHLVVFKEGSKPNLLGPILPVLEEGKAAKETATSVPDAPPIVVHPAPGTVAPFALSGVFTDAQFQMIFRTLAGKGAKTPNGKTDEATDNSFGGWEKEIAGQVQAVIRMPSVTTRSGQKATIEVAREFIYPTVFEKVEGKTKNEALKIVPTTFEMKPVGFLLDVEPVIGPDGYTIDLVLAPQLPSFLGWREYTVADGQKVKSPIFESQKLSTSVTVWEGQTVAFAGEAGVAPFLMDPSLKGEDATKARQHPVMIFVTARMIDPSGNPVKKGDEQSEVKSVGVGPPAQIVPFRLGAKSFGPADLIEVLEVRSTSAKFEKGDTIVVKGRCRLGSADEAVVRLMTTTVFEPSGPVVDVGSNQSASLKRGVHPFELRYTLEHDGFLKLCLRNGDGSASYAEVYFGTQEQMDKQAKLRQ